MDKMDMSKEDQLRLAEVIKAKAISYTVTDQTHSQSQKVSKTALPKLA